MEIHFKMQEHTPSLRYIHKIQHRHAKKLNKISSEHFDIVEKLHEQLISLKMQNNIFIGLYAASETENEIKESKEYIRQGLAALEELRMNFQRKLSNNLIDKQIGMDEQNERKHLLSNYQNRVFELVENLYNKELMICVDHIGKKWDQKPIEKRVKQFDKKDQTSMRIVQVLQKRMKMNNEIESKLNRTKIDSTLASSTKEQKFSKSFETQIYTDRPLHKNIFSEKQNRQPLVSCDPTIRKIVKMIEKQQKTYSTLSQQYIQLCNQNTLLSEEHASLVSLYSNSR